MASNFNGPVQRPGTNPYFDNFYNQGEQDLWDELNIEAIKIYGIDLYYIPRVLVDFDPIYGEDSVSRYDNAIAIEMYIKSVDGFQGDGVFFSKFDVEIRDQLTLTVAKTIFEENVTSEYSIPRPNEGDLVYFPLQQKLFQIRYVDYKPFFYQHGTLQTYDLVCELFEYSSEEFNTGIPEIDELQTKFSIDALDYAIMTEDGDYLATENGNYLTLETYKISDIDPVTNNQDFTEEQIGDPTTTTDDVIDWSEIDPFSESGTY